MRPFEPLILSQQTDWQFVADFSYSGYRHEPPPCAPCNCSNQSTIQQYTNARRDSGRATPWGCWSLIWEIFHVCSSFVGDMNCLSRRRHTSRLPTGCYCPLYQQHHATLYFPLQTFTARCSKRFALLFTWLFRPPDRSYILPLSFLFLSLRLQSSRRASGAPSEVVALTKSQWRQWGKRGRTRTAPGDTLQGVTLDRRKKVFCGQIYKELWTNEVGQVKKLWGDTRVKSVKVIVMSKKRS